jgi:hypothetical protein
MGLSSKEAKKIAAYIYSEAVKKQQAAGTKVLPDAAAEIVLSGLNPFLPEDYLLQLKSEGVTFEDIVGWWNMPDIARWAIICYQEHLLEVTRLTWLQHSGENEVASKFTFQTYPVFIYGPPVEQPPYLVGENKPLPCELKTRVDGYIDRRVQQEGSSFRDEVNQYSSMNAFVRDRIRSGEM